MLLTLSRPLERKIALDLLFLCGGGRGEEMNFSRVLGHFNLTTIKLTLT